MKNKMRNGQADIAGVAMWIAIAIILSSLYWSFSATDRANASIAKEAAKAGLEQCEYKDHNDRIKLKWQKECK